MSEIVVVLVEEVPDGFVEGLLVFELGGEGLRAELFFHLKKHLYILIAILPPLYHTQTTDQKSSI